MSLFFGGPTIIISHTMNQHMYGRMNYIENYAILHEFQMHSFCAGSFRCILSVVPAGAATVPVVVVMDGVDFSIRILHIASSPI